MNKLNTLSDIIILSLIPITIIGCLLISVFFAANINYLAAIYFLLLSFIIYLISPDEEEENIYDS